MAKEISKPIKKRGRPKKEPKSNIIENEEVKQVQMSQQENITMNQVGQRWATIFSKYSNMGFDSLNSAWTQAWTQLNNPFVQNYRIKEINARPQKLSSDELKKSLANPENSEMNLQRVSMSLYYTNYVYNSLIKLNRDTPLYNYYVIPQYVSDKDYETDLFKEESQKVDKILKAFKPNLTLKTISTQVYTQGKTSYLPRISYDNKEVNFFLLEKLNSDMVKLTGFGSEQQFITSFNMMIFLQPGYDVSQYPQFIRDVWEDMLDVGMIKKDKKGKNIYNPKAELVDNGTLEWNGSYYLYWVELPQDLCYTFYSDGSHPNAFPDMIGMFNDFNDLDDYRWLQANLLSKGINSVLTAEVPLTRDAKAGSDSTVITPDTILGYQDFFGTNISGNIFPFFAPFTNFELHNLENQPEALDIIYDRTRDLIASSGNSALLTLTDKPSIASVKAAQNIQASKADYLTRQFENFLNNILNKNFELKYKWKVFLWGDIFNKSDDIKVLKELVISGLEGTIPKLLSSLGMTVEDYKSSVKYVKALGIKIEKSFEIEKMETQNKLDIKSSKTNVEEEKEESEEKKVGRPMLDENDIENDSSGASRDAGTNVSDIKEFSSNIKKCDRCGSILSNNENILCKKCLDEIYKMEN